MKLRRWSFYRESDGHFISLRRTSNNEKAVERETPAGCIAIEGDFDRFRQRVDLASGEIVVDESLGKDRDRERRRDAALLELRELDQRQHRRVREILAANDEQLAAIEADAEAVRAKLRDISDEKETSEAPRRET